MKTAPRASVGSSSPAIALPPPAAASPAYPPRVIALGDSTVYGYGDAVNGGWVEGLRRRWMAQGSAGPVLYNLGVRGDGVQQVLQRLEAEFSRRGELRNQMPDAIILSVGTNDSARLGHAGGRNFMNVEAFEAAIAQLLEQSLRLAPVYFVGMPPVDETRMPFAQCLYYSHRDQRRYKEATRQACQARQVPYLDVFDTWMERVEREGMSWLRDRLLEDGLHPNTLGYSEILSQVMTWSALNLGRLVLA